MKRLVWWIAGGVIVGWLCVLCALGGQHVLLGAQAGQWNVGEAVNSGGSDPVGILAFDHECDVPPCQVHITCDSGIHDPPEDIPDVAYRLYPPSPNPFDGTTVIQFDTPSGRGRMTVQIVTAGGRLVRTLAARHERGTNSVVWDGRDDRGRQVASGVYYYRLVGTNVYGEHKMALVR